MEVTKSVVRVRETNPLRRYKTVKKNATYKPYPDFDKLMGECDLCDGLDSTGRTDKVTHPAHTRLVVQCELFMRWYSVVFKNYHNRVERECVFELIRMFGGSVGSLLSLLDSRVEQNRSAHIPIDFPVAWCKSVVEGEVKRVLKDRLKLEKELAEIRETVTVTEVSNVPALTSPKQSSSKSAEQPRKPWDKPTPLTESVWHERYDKIAKGDLMGLNVMTLEPGKEGDVFCTGDRDKDVLERCNIRNRSTSVFSRSPIEQEAYDRRHASLDKSARESARKAGVYDMIYGKEEPTEQETMEPKKPIKEP